MDIGTGIAIMGVWLFASANALSKNITGNGMIVGIVIAIIFTIVFLF